MRDKPVGKASNPKSQAPKKLQAPNAQFATSSRAESRDPEELPLKVSKPEAEDRERLTNPET
jgi:hypothetical protein